MHTTALIFFGTIVTLLIFIVRLILKISKRRSIVSTLKTLIIIIVSYSILWTFFYLISTTKAVPLGTDICFDDWCATITKIERPKYLGLHAEILYPKGQFIVLNIKMSNHARGIAQKPSEPRIHIIDGNGNIYSFSEAGQQALERQIGKQISIGARLELHQSVDTQLVFDLPGDAQNSKVLIEEGPFITQLLFWEDKEVFLVP